MEQSELEKQYNAIQKSLEKETKLEELTIPELRILYAYEIWADGADWDTTLEILNQTEVPKQGDQSEADYYISELRDTFCYES